MKYTTCSKCNIKIANNSIKKHTNSKTCIKNQSPLTQEGILLPNGKYKCPYCDKDYKKHGIGTHIWRVHGEGKNWTGNNDGYKNGTRKSVNQFIKAKEEGKIFIVSEETRKKISKSNKNRDWGEYWTPARRKKHSKAMLEAVKKYPESYSASNVSGRTKLYEINDTKVKGTWELLVAKYLNDSGISWVNNILGFEYTWDNGVHLYFPDFYLHEYNIYRSKRLSKK